MGVRPEDPLPLAPSRLLPWLGPGLVFALYLGVVWRFAENIPIQDDYRAILDALTRLRAGGSLFRYLFEPHNEHLIAFGRAISGLQLLALGHVQLAGLILLGNLCVGGLFLCWRASFPELRGDPLAQTAAALLLIQLRYWETSTWATSALASFPALLFAWSALLALRAGPSRVWFALAAAAALLAALSQGNGILVFAPAALGLALSRRWVACGVWVALGALAAAGYVWLQLELGGGISLPRGEGAGWSSLSVFALGFLGSIGPGAASAPWCGALLLLGFAACSLTQRQRPGATALLVLAFLLLGAAAASLGRAGVDADLAATSRYAIHSSALAALLLGSCWPRGQRGTPRLALSLALVVSACAVNALLFASAQTELRMRRFRLGLLFAPGPPCERYAFPDQSAAELLLARALAQRVIELPLEGTPPRSRCEPFSARVLGRGEELPAALGTRGDVELAAVEGSSIRLEGWAPVRDAEPTRQLLISTRSPPRAVRLRTLARPEIAYALRNPELLRSGFALRLHYGSRARALAVFAELCLGFGSAERVFALLPLHAERCERRFSSRASAALAARAREGL